MKLWFTHVDESQLIDPLIIKSMITTFNTAVTQTASEILGKHHQKKKTWVTAEILDLCDRRRKLRKK